MCSVLSLCLQHSNDQTYEAHEMWHISFHFMSAAICKPVVSIVVPPADCGLLTILCENKVSDNNDKD